MRRNTSRKYELRLVATMMVALSYALCVLGQEMVKKPIQLNTAGSRSSNEYRVDDTSPRPIEVEISDANDKDWNFVQFEKMPEGVQLRAQKDVNGYQDGEVIKEKTWYPFKKTLPLTLDLNSGPRGTVDLSLTFAKVTDQNVIAFLKDFTVTEVRAWLDKNSQELTIGDSRRLKIIDQRSASGGAATGTGTSIASPSPSPTTTQTSLITYLTEEDETLGTIVLIILAALGVLGVFLFIWYGVPFLKGRYRSFKFKRSVRKRDAPAPVELDLGLGPSSGKSATRTDQTNQDDIRSQLGIKPTVYNPPPKDPPPLRPDNAHLDRLEDRVTQIVEKVQKIEEHDALIKDIQDTTRTEMSNQQQWLLSQMDSKLARLTETEVRPVQALMNDQATQFQKMVDNLSKNIEAQSRELRELTNREQNLKDQLIDLSKELGRLDKRTKERQDDFANRFQREPIPDSFYAKTLGEVLGQNLDPLKDGNFDRLIGQRLEQFFQTVKRSEGLQELRTRAERIIVALKEVAKQVEGLNPAAYDQIRQRLQQVETVVADLSGMQSQLQERRAVLQIPVSLHSGGRQTLLDGLGRGIKREIEKLEDPERYFEGELERLITADVIAIVDICDKQVASQPGARAELEKPLADLFDAASLYSILPRPGDTFRTAEQDLIETSQQNGPSLKVAQVVTRGFIYKQGDRETLLRKAGVIVYR